VHSKLPVDQARQQSAELQARRDDVLWNCEQLDGGL